MNLIFENSIIEMHIDKQKIVTCYLLFLFQVQLKTNYFCLKKIKYSVVFIRIYHCCQGNSNSIATVDVGAGYVGQEDYNAFPVAFLLGLATYAGPIYWFMAFLAKLNTLNPSRR